MGRGDIMLEELETQVLLYRYSIMRDNPEIDKEQLRNKVNRKFKEKNKKVLCEMMSSHLNLRDSRHKC